jgi:hypothetical protein
MIPRNDSHRTAQFGENERTRQTSFGTFQGLVHLILGRSYAAAVSVAGEVTRDSLAA